MNLLNPESLDGDGNGDGDEDDELSPRRQIHWL